MKPKALLFLPYIAPYRIDMLNELGNYYEITVVIKFENAPDQKFNQNRLRNKLKINVKVFNTGIFIGTRQIPVGVYNLLKVYKPDIVFSNEFSIISLLISLYHKISFFDFIHYATTSDNILMAKNAMWFRRISRSLVLKSTKGIIVYNNDVKDWYKSHFSQLKVRVCPNIQNPSSFVPNIERQKRLSQQYFHKHNLLNKIVILYVGRLYKAKGIDLLLNAFAKTITGSEKLVFVGDGPEKKKLKNLVKVLNLNDFVIFAGRFDGDPLYAWYHTANFLVLPSIYEPFGAVINESLILGLPVLCSKFAGASFLVKPNKNGFVFNPKDELEFCYYINLSLIKFKDRKINGNLMIYSFDTSIHQYIKAYSEK